MGKKGFTLVDLTIVLVVFVILILVLPKLVLWRMRCKGSGRMCGTNLKGIGTAMLTYANEYNDEYPRAGSRGSEGINTGGIANWLGADEAEAFGISDGLAGKATIESCLYYLVKYADVTPKQFICDEDTYAKEFKRKSYKIGKRDLTEVWNFGPGSGRKHCSYSYHTPFSDPNGIFLTAMSDPGLAICADANPYLWDGKAKEAPQARDYVFGGSKEQEEQGNNRNHKNEGQNVLFNDGSAIFEKRAYCGVDDDNIYTLQDGGDVEAGIAVQATSQLATRTDSVLVQSGAIIAGTKISSFEEESEESQAEPESADK